jgi:hypothetical protein
VGDRAIPLCSSRPGALKGGVGGAVDGERWGRRVGGGFGVACAEAPIGGRNRAMSAVCPMIVAAVTSPTPKGSVSVVPRRGSDRARRC